MEALTFNSPFYFIFVGEIYLYAQCQSYPPAAKHQSKRWLSPPCKNLFGCSNDLLEDSPCCRSTPRSSGSAPACTRTAARSAPRTPACPRALRLEGNRVTAATGLGGLASAGVCRLIMGYSRAKSCRAEGWKVNSNGKVWNHANFCLFGGFVKSSLSYRPA